MMHRDDETSESGAETGRHPSYLQNVDDGCGCVEIWTATDETHDEDDGE